MAIQLRFLRNLYKKYKEKTEKIVNSKIYAVVNIVILILSAISLSNGRFESSYAIINYLFFELDKMYSIFFIIDCIINLSITPIKKTLTTFWGLFNVAVGIISYCSLYDLPNFTSIRMWLLIKYLPTIPGLKYIQTICSALGNSMPIIKDIGIFTGFFFTSIGLLSVAFLGGRLTYRCVDNTSEFNDEMICSPSSNTCPKNFSCKNVHTNPDKGTISFDNILISWLNIFQILTTEGWSNIYFTVSSVTTKAIIVFFIFIIIIGNWLILQLIVATVVSNLQNSITIHNIYNFKMKKTFISNIDSTNLNQRFRKMLETFINKQWVENVILCITIIDTVFICMVSNKISEETHEKIFYMSLICTIIFIIEMLIKIYVLGLKGYVTSSFYNVTDGIFTLISIGELIVQDDNGVAVFRVLRAFRVLRLTKFLPQLSNLIAVFCDSAKPLLSLFTIWSLSIISFSLFAVQFFEGGMNFSNNKPRNNFENFFYSFLSVIQLYTVENWDSIKTNVAESKNIYATIIPVIIIIIGAYIFSQFLVAILLNSILDRIKNDYYFQELNNDKRDAKHIIKYVFNELFDAKFDPDDAGIFSTQSRIEGPQYAALATESDYDDDKSDQEKKKKGKGGENEEKNGKDKENIINMKEDLKSYTLLRTLKRNPTNNSIAVSENKENMTLMTLNDDFTTNIPLQTLKKGKSVDLTENNPDFNIKDNNISNSFSLTELEYLSSNGSGENLIQKFENDATIDMINIENDNNEDSNMDDKSIDSHSKNSFKVKNLISNNIAKLKEKYPINLNEPASNNINFPTVFSRTIDRSKTRREMMKAKQNERIFQRNESKMSFNKESSIPNNIDANSIVDDESSDCSNPRADTLFKSNYQIIESDSNNSKDDLAKIEENKDYSSDINDLSSKGKIKLLYKSFRDSYFVHICYKFSISHIYVIFLNIITILSCVSIVFENPTLKESKHYNLIFAQDILFASVFSFDLALKFISNGIIFSKHGYLKKFICWIDIFTVFISIANLTSYRDYFHSIRLLKLCYIMRFIYMQDGLRIVTVAIWKTIPSICVAFIPYAFYLLIFSLIGISLFVDKGWECSDSSILEQDKCIGNYTDRFNHEVKRHWIPYSVSYDNFFDGLLSTFVVSHQEAWPDIMYRYINLSSDDKVRPEKIHLGYSIFFVCGILIGNWLFLSVITAVTFSSLKRNQDIVNGIQYLTNGQRKILDYLKILVTNTPKFSERKGKEDSEHNRKIRDFVQSNFLKKFMLTVICVNIICMMLVTYNINSTLKFIFSIFEIIFTIIYILELILLFRAYGVTGFFKSFWNILSFVIVVTAVISVVFESIIPQTLLVFIRLIRIIHIFQYSKGIKALGMAVMFNFTQLINVLILMFLTCFVYAVIGYTYFGDMKIEHTNYLNENVNFSSFGRSLVTVFIFSTGEGWPFGMADCMGKTVTNCDPSKENCGSRFATVYFITLHIILNWILLNSFSAITVDTFITVLDEHDEIARLEKVWDKFNEHWIEYDINKSGEVEFIELINIYDKFELPRGTQWGNHSRTKGLLATKPPITELFKNIKVKNNKCNYNDVIFSFLNCWMGEELPESYVRKEKVIPKTGYEKKIILKTKEKSISGSSNTISNNLKNKDLKSANFYFSDEDDSKNTGPPRQFNPITKLDKNSKSTDVFIVNSPKTMSSDKSDDDDEKTIEFKNPVLSDTINSDIDNSYSSEEGLSNSDFSLNSINENGYCFINTSETSLKSSNEKTPPIQTSQVKFSNKTVAFDNPPAEKHKKYKLQLKETFSDTFTKGKAILKPSTYFAKESPVKEKEEELPFTVVYSVWKIQRKFKARKQEGEIIIQ